MLGQLKRALDKWLGYNSTTYYLYAGGDIVMYLTTISAPHWGPRLIASLIMFGCLYGMGEEND